MKIYGTYSYILKLAEMASKSRKHGISQKAIWAWWLIGMILRGWGFLWQTDRRTDICNCRVAFATEKLNASLSNKLECIFWRLQNSCHLYFENTNVSCILLFILYLYLWFQCSLSQNWNKYHWWQFYNQLIINFTTFRIVFT